VHRQPHGLAAGVAGATGSSDRWGGSWGLFAVGSVSSNVQRTCMGYAATQNRACNTITHRTPERCGLVAVGRIKAVTMPGSRWLNITYIHTLTDLY